MAGWLKGWHQSKRCQLSDQLKIIFRIRGIVFQNQRQILKQINVKSNNFHVFHVFLNFGPESQNVDFCHFEASRWEVQNKREWLKLETRIDMTGNDSLWENKFHISKIDRDIQVENIDFFTF